LAQYLISSDLEDSTPANLISAAGVKTLTRFKNCGDANKVNSSGQNLVEDCSICYPFSPLAQRNFPFFLTA